MRMFQCTDIISTIPAHERHKAQLLQGGDYKFLKKQQTGFL